MATSVTTTHHTLADSSHDHGHHSHDHPCHDHDHYHHIPLEVGVGPLKFDAPLSVASVQTCELYEHTQQPEIGPGSIL